MSACGALVEKKIRSCDRSGRENKSGHLETRRLRRAAFEQPTNSLFFITRGPTCCPWMNQIEFGFQASWYEKVLKRGNFTSVDDLQRKVLASLNTTTATHGETLQMDLSGRALACITSYLFMPTCTRTIVAEDFRQSIYW